MAETPRDRPIRPAFYDLFIETLIATLKTHDPLFSDGGGADGRSGLEGHREAGDRLHEVKGLRPVSAGSHSPICTVSAIVTSAPREKNLAFLPFDAQDTNIPTLTRSIRTQ